LSLLEFKKVHFHYGDIKAVSDLNFSLQDGELGVLIGPSGCGKTTTLKMVNRLLIPTSGLIHYQGQPLDSYDPVELRRTMGYVIQSVGLFPHWTVEGNIAAVPRLLKWKAHKIKARIGELLELVGLNPQSFFAKYPAQLSGGEAQRVGIARALAADPPLLLMDEPFGSLDPVQRQRLQRALLSIQNRIRKTILMVTHDLDEAILLADRILILNQGRLIQNDSTETILNNPADSFVRTFVGTDRSLKRLIRFKVEQVMKPAGSCGFNESPPKMGDAPWCWVVDSEGRPLGWVAQPVLRKEQTAAQALSPFPGKECLVEKSTHLKDVLSLMLSTGMKVLPVVDDQGRLIGEVSMGTIEAITLEDRSE